nr:MAG TPA: hypothetical protein [Crassvirales sp.]
MEKLIASLILINIVLIYFLDLKSRKIKILENNWETAKKVIGEYDPEFRKYVEKR